MTFRPCSCGSALIVEHRCQRCGATCEAFGWSKLRFDGERTHSGMSLAPNAQKKRIDWFEIGLVAVSVVAVGMFFFVTFGVLVAGWDDEAARTRAWMPEEPR